ncbi:DegV domain-containing protein [Clostridium tepidiprofundi DSM 19306]|uniref:DegV domain-containing protein n=1 Tax=Clostridium tepidiprofundi DSM 19306 TaxID=1121338 RepID=A0A151B037_9CLOT|nr:DegV family protein [Clostridium tepidiprofundi]KYH33279.1 DegV domain-containing protein [Clostridium tepidiprofundi DSM 19306]
MNEFVILTDSCSDLPLEFVKENNISSIPMTLSYEGKEYLDNFGQNITHEKLFDDMRKGSTPTTSQINVSTFYEMYKKHVNENKSILYIGLSSSLSGSMNNAHLAKNMILEEFPNAKIYIVDSLSASLSEGLLVIKACEMKSQGKSIDEIVDFLENSKQNLNTYLTVSDLIHLKRGGRLSPGVAIIGTLLHIKPVLHINNKGKIVPIKKIRGRNKSILKLAEICSERILNPENQTIVIGHGDCIEDAEKLKNEILKRISVKKVIINCIGPVIGSHAGPDTLFVAFFGIER